MGTNPQHRKQITIYTIREDLVFHLTLDASTGNDGMKLHALLVGELTTLGEQFLRYLGNGCAFYLAIYKYVVHNFFQKFRLGLSNNTFVQQFLYQAVDVLIAACQGLALLSLEHDVLHSLHLGR